MPSINFSVNIYFVGKKRTDADLDLFEGKVRTFEWFWTEADEMPGRDDFDALDKADQADVIATFEHWGNLEIGKRVSNSLINGEHDDPKILAAKAGKHRFSMFHAGDNIWIVCRYYEKQKQKLDKAGKTAIRLTITDKNDYERRVSAGEYYERT